MATLDAIAFSLRDAIKAALDANGFTLPPAQIGTGAPFGPSLAEILEQDQAQITIYPQFAGTQNRTDRKPLWKTFSNIPVTLLVSINGLQATFSGTLSPGFNVHTFFGNPLKDYRTQTISGDTLNSLAARISSGVNNLDYQGITASSLGAVLTLAGNTGLKVNIGGGATMIREVRRMMTPFQVSVWAANPYDRANIGNIINTMVGTAFPIPFLTTPDGSAVWIRLRNDRWNDDSQSSYTLYEYHAIFEMEYPTIQSIGATAIEAIDQTVDQIDGNGNIVTESVEVIDGT